MNQKVEKALKLFDDGFNCSQSVIGAFCSKFGLDEELAMKLTCGFGGGMRCGEVCPNAIRTAVVLLEKVATHSRDFSRELVATDVRD